MSALCEASKESSKQAVILNKLTLGLIGTFWPSSASVCLLPKASTTKCRALTVDVRYYHCCYLRLSYSVK